MKDTFKEIIKQEWEAEFPNDLGEPIEIEDSIFSIYQELVERICIKVWNSALELAADKGEVETELDEYYGEFFEKSVVDKRVHTKVQDNYTTPT